MNAMERARDERWGELIVLTGVAIAVLVVAGTWVWWAANRVPAPRVPVPVVTPMTVAPPVPYIATCDEDDGDRPCQVDPLYARPRPEETDRG